MKKATLLVTLMLLLALLCGCESEDTVQYGFNCGRYVLEQSDGDTATPYILINEYGFSLVLNIAVSYQPSGTVEQDGNKLVLKADFAGEKVRMGVYAYRRQHAPLFPLRLRLFDQRCHDRGRLRLCPRRRLTILNIAKRAMLIEHSPFKHKGSIRTPPLP